jgi:hypothetical protein
MIETSLQHAQIPAHIKFQPHPPSISPPTPTNQFPPTPPWGQGRAFGKPRPETQGTLNHPHSFAKCSHHHVPKHSASNTVLHGGSAEHGSKGGGTHSHVAPPTRFSHTLSLPPPLPTLVYTHPPTLPPSHIEA